MKGHQHRLGHHRFVNSKTIVIFTLRTKVLRSQRCNEKEKFETDVT